MIKWVLRGGRGVETDLEVRVRFPSVVMEVVGLWGQNEGDVGQPGFACTGASSLSVFLRKDCRLCMLAVILHFPTLRRMPDQSLNCSTMSRRVTMSSMVLVTSVTSSAYHLLASRRPHEFMR